TRKGSSKGVMDAPQDLRGKSRAHLMLGNSIADVVHSGNYDCIYRSGSYSVYRCVFSGYSEGRGTYYKIMMILLVILLLVMAVNSIFLEGSAGGLEFYLVPDFGKVIERGVGNVIFDAMTHAFFTLSVGIGSMAIFGSYLSKERKLTGEAINVVALDTFIALMAGIIIIPACFAYNISPDSGPSLLFITLPNVFNRMPGGSIWGLLFFVFMSFAALSTVIAVYENIISISMDIFGWDRKKACIINLCGIGVLSLPAVFGYNILDFVKPLGDGTNIMDLEDFLVSYNILPLGSLLFVLFCTKNSGWGFDNFVNEADQGKGITFPKWIRLYMKYILPLIVLFIYFKGYYGFFENKGTLTLVIWMTISVLMVGYVFWLTIGKKKSTNK
ncbi:MAG: sodium-dependent transporter, partial [Lachnospiraceae bacterium]|nr:sodium-dependent transporter [Lachnospiraceae bacterium]